MKIENQPDDEIESIANRNMLKWAMETTPIVHMSDKELNIWRQSMGLPIMANPHDQIRRYNYCIDRGFHEKSYFDTCDYCGIKNPARYQHFRTGKIIDKVNENDE